MIIITNTKDKEIITCQSFLCRQIQKEFDISPFLLDNLINKPEFTDHCQFLYEQYYCEFLDSLNTFKEKFSAINNPSNLEINCGEYEKCGKLLKTHHNGHLEYCNFHKYLHSHQTMPMSHQGGLDHQFTIKEDHQIVKEYYTTSIHTLYQSYLNKLYSSIRQVFYHILNNLCEIDSISVDSVNLHDLETKMSRETSIFKSKLLYEHINIDGSTDPSSSYYLKVYRLREHT
jgi:hypothetical protein